MINEKPRRRWPKIVLSVIGALILIACIYVLYIILSYERIPDKQDLEVVRPDSAAQTPVPVGREQNIVSYNIGFGAYTPDFTFFMDGGSESVAASKESVIKTTKGAAATVKKYNSDFAIIEEVDLDSTRSHHVNQSDMLNAVFPNYYRNFAINYDSAFLMVPPWDPIGKSLSGIGLYSKYPITDAMRRSFPIASGFNKFLDLDRCYSVSRVPTADGKELCIYSVHMSAYGHDATVRSGQVNMLVSDMAAERKAGNYVICGGDFNHDMRNTSIKGNSAETWAHPFPRESLPSGFSNVMDLVPKAKKAAMVESTRNTDIPYDPDKSFMVTVDGFIISDNVKCINYQVMDEQFRYSDHNPVQLTFELTP